MAVFNKINETIKLLGRNDEDYDLVNEDECL